MGSKHTQPNTLLHTAELEIFQAGKARPVEKVWLGVRKEEMTLALYVPLGRTGMVDILNRHLHYKAWQIWITL